MHLWCLSEVTLDYLLCDIVIWNSTGHYGIFSRYQRTVCLKIFFSWLHIENVNKLDRWQFDQCSSVLISDRKGFFLPHFWDFFFCSYQVVTFWQILQKSKNINNMFISSSVKWSGFSSHTYIITFLINLTTWIICKIVFIMLITIFFNCENSQKKLYKEWYNYYYYYYSTFLRFSLVFFGLCKRRTFRCRIPFFKF